MSSKESVFFYLKNKLFFLVLPGCSSTFKSPIGRITTPDIPITYRHDVKCTWTIQVPNRFKLAMKLKMPWENNNSSCVNSVHIHNNKYEKKHSLNGQLVCSAKDGVDQIIMERNTAIIDLTLKVTIYSIHISVQLDNRYSISRTSNSTLTLNLW